MARPTLFSRLPNRLPGNWRTTVGRRALVTTLRRRTRGLDAACAISNHLYSWLLHDNAAFHDELNMLESADVGERVSLDSDQVCVFRSLDDTQTILPAKQLRSV